MQQCSQCGSPVTESELSSQICLRCFLEAGLDKDGPAESDDSFASYKVICQIGQGGMGIVYLAEQTQPVQREVALKVLKTGLDTAALLRRFETERQALALMAHPNIAPLYDAGTSTKGRPYFVMEFVDGLPITAACDQHRSSIRERLALFAQLCRAIDHAHRKGIVHRDIKPSNVLVTERDGQLAPKVIDFGIARAVTGHLTGHTVATEFGELLGTPEYMSPEQATFGGHAVGPASDTYSLGVLLYELLAGVPPFDPAKLRESGFAEATRIIREQQPVSPLRRLSETGLISEVASRRNATPETLQRLLSHDLARILAMCLHKDPKCRYASVAALAEDVERYLRGEPVLAQGPSFTYRARKWLHRYRAPVGGVLIAALTAIVVLWISHHPSAPVTPAGPATPPEIRQLTSYSGTETEPTFSPDGKQFAFVWDGGVGNFDIYVQAVDGGSPLRLTFDAAQDLFPAWSPDGTQLAFVRVSTHEKALYVVPVRGGHERKITSLSTQILTPGDMSLTTRPPGPAWSLDGRSIVIADCREHLGPDALYQYSVDGRSCRKLTSPEPNSSGDAIPAFSPDGHALAFVRTASMLGNGTLYVLQNGRLEAVVSERVGIQGLSWMSNNELLFSSNTLWSIAVRGGRPSPILGTGRGMIGISYSTTKGRVAYAERYLKTNVWRLRLDQKTRATPQRLLSSANETDSPDYSPDGNAIVFVSNRSTGWHIWRADADGKNSVQLTPIGSKIGFGTPHWSPDSRQIAYDTPIKGHSAIGIMNRDGSNAHIFASDPWDDMMPSWSHDGQSIYFTCNINGANQICRKPVATGPAKVLTTERGGRDARESPDRRFVFYEGVNKGIWRVSVDGGRESPLGGLSDVDPRRYWTVAGNAIYFLRGPLPPWIVYRYDLTTERISAVAKIDKQPVFGPGLSVSPDLAYLIFSQVDEHGADIVMAEGVFPPGRQTP